MMTKTISNDILKDVDVVILTGGQGSRLREVVNDRQKTMAEIDQQPFLDILIDYIAGYGFKRFILCTGYMASSIEEHYNNKKNDKEILFSKEDRPLGTGGAIKNAQELILSDSFLVVNGDSFCPIDFLDFFNFHNKNNALVSMVIVGSEENKDSGNVILDNSQKIIQFQENKQSKRKKAFTNTGIYFFKKDIFSLIPSRVNYSLEYSLFPELIDREFYGYITQKRFIEIGTPEGYLKAKKYYKSWIKIE